MTLITLTATDLAVAAILILLLGILSWSMRLGVGRELYIAAARTVVQLLLVGLLLTVVFERAQPGWVALIALVMLMVAGYEALSRQERRFKGWWGSASARCQCFCRRSR
jgi:putative ABC transport system permease protein